MDKPENVEKPEEAPVKGAQQPVPPPAVPQEEGEKPNVIKKFWYLFVIFGVVIVTSLIIFVYGYQKLSQEKPAPSPTPTPIPTPVEEVDEQTSALEEQGTSDEIEDIEADLEDTELSEIDKELEDIDSELSSP